MPADPRARMGQKPKPTEVREVRLEPRAAPAPIEDRLPALSDQELANLHANAQRLSREGAPKHSAEAERVLPLIEAEIQTRRANKPSPPPRKSTTRRKTAASSD